VSHTVRELKDQVRLESGWRVGSRLEFSRISRAHAAFWEKLHELGWIRKSKELEKGGDADATAQLTDAEYEELMKEFHKIHDARKYG